MYIILLCLGATFDPDDSFQNAFGTVWNNTLHMYETTTGMPCMSISSNHLRTYNASSGMGLLAFISGTFYEISTLVDLCLYQIGVTYGRLRLSTSYLSYKISLCENVFRCLAQSSC